MVDVIVVECSISKYYCTCFTCQVLSLFSNHVIVFSSEVLSVQTPPDFRPTPPPCTLPRSLPHLNPTLYLHHYPHFQIWSSYLLANAVFKWHAHFIFEVTSQRLLCVLFLDVQSLPISDLIFIQFHSCFEYNEEENYANRQCLLTIRVEIFV